MTTAYLGVDVGTSSTKAVALDPDGGLLGSTSVAHAVDRPAAGRFEHDAESVWWGGVSAALRALASALPSDVSVQAVGLSSCGPCIVPVDPAGRPLRPGILYGVDTRATEQIAALEQRIGASDVQDAYGMPLTSQSAGPKVDWLEQTEPRVWAATSTLLTANGFAAFRLTGERRADHHQAAYFAPYYREGGWDRTHDRTGVVDRLPALAWSDEVVGRVTADAAATTGLPAGTPVVIGSSDGLTAAYGAGAVDGATAVLNYGSTLGLTVMTPDRGRPGGVWRTPGARAGQTSLVAALSTGGALTTWFAEQFAREQTDATAALSSLAAEAAASPAGARGLLLLPYFAGERTPFYDPGAAGVLLGLRLEHTRGDHYRAVLEGTALGVRHLLAELDRMDVPVTRIRAVGGGTGTPLWQQVVSDATGVPQDVVGQHHGAATGAAILAAEALGEGTALDRPELSRPVHPDSTLKPLYDNLFGLYLDAYERTRPLIEGLSR